MSLNKHLRTSLFLLRLGIGWLFLYAGVSKLIDPAWTAAGYLTNATTFNGFYSWLASPALVGWVDLLNKWGLTLIGAALILGIFTRLASWAGLVLVILYYFPVLHFPYAGEHSYLVDEHIIYALSFLVLIYGHAGKIWGLDRIFKRG